MNKGALAQNPILWSIPKETMPRDRYASHRIQELVDARKTAREGFVLKWEIIEEHSASIKIPLDVVEGSFVDFRLMVSAGRLSDPGTYRAALLLDGIGIRGGAVTNRHSLIIPAAPYLNHTTKPVGNIAVLRRDHIAI